MSTNNEEQEVASNSAYNAFPEPQTIPSGWDTSAFSFKLHTESELEEDDSMKGTQGNR